MKAQNAHAVNSQAMPVGRTVPTTDNEILSQLFSTHGRRLYRTAFRLLGCHEDAEDAVQDGMLSAAKHLQSFRGRAKPSTWLTRIVINAALMHLRRARTLRFISLDEERTRRGEPLLVSRLADERPTPDKAFARQENLQILRGKIGELPVRLRRVSRLRYINGMSIAETAQQLSLTQGAVKARLYRARAKLLDRKPDPAWS
jgi:RNA polymerase sigma-70 factor (ECF subfamily)